MTALTINPWNLPGFDMKRPILIAGPCSAETERQTLDTAIELAKGGVKLFRAGIWKPRTRPGSFEGVGVAGLPWLQQVKKETNMFVITEVANAMHVREALQYDIDMLWIGARTTANPFAVQEIANALRGTDLPVLVKNPVNPDLDFGLEHLSDSMRQESPVLLQFIVDLAAMSNLITEIHPNGLFPLNCTGDCLSFQLLPTRAI